MEQARFHARRRRAPASGTRRARWSTASLTSREGAGRCASTSAARRRAIVGYRAIKNGDVIDVDRAGAYAARGFLGADPRPRRRAADPRPRRVLHPRLAREDADPRRSRRRNGADRSGDRRVPRPLRRLLRSRLRPGRRTGAPRARAVLEVRSRDVPFLLEDGQPVGRLVYETLADAAGPSSMAPSATSNYQAPGAQAVEAFSDVVRDQGRPGAGFSGIARPNVIFFLAGGRVFLYGLGLARRREVPRREFFWPGPPR